MKEKLIAFIRSWVTPKHVLRDLHEAMVLTSSGGLVAFLFSGVDLPLWSLGAIGGAFIFAVILTKWEDN